MAPVLAWPMVKYSTQTRAVIVPAYARRWQLKDGKAHEDRLLFRARCFGPQEPFAGQDWGKAASP